MNLAHAAAARSLRTAVVNSKVLSRMRAAQSKLPMQSGCARYPIRGLNLTNSAFPQGLFRCHELIDLRMFS
jgi:hypothetical protein